MISLFRIISILEGISYVLLLFVAVPIKYLQNEELYVKILGMPHGLLFISYILLAFLIQFENNIFIKLKEPNHKWKPRTFFMILIASIIPFGTFYIERKYINPACK